MQSETILYVSIVAVAVVLVAGVIGLYFHRRHRRMLEAMSSEERELYDAEKEYNRTVKKAERELWTATKAHEAKVMWAEGKLTWAKKKGQDRLGSYTGVHGNKIELWENKVRVPRSGTKENWMESFSNRFLKEHYFQEGSIEARVENHGSSELYLIVEGDNFVGFVQCKPDDAPRVREFAVKINNASKSIKSVLQTRDEAIAKATTDLETAQNNRISIDEAARRLEAVKEDTSRLEAARANVQALAPERELDSSDE